MFDAVHDITLRCLKDVSTHSSYGLQRDRQRVEISLLSGQKTHLAESVFTKDHILEASFWLLHFLEPDL